MSEKCRYGRDYEVVYIGSERKEQQYICPRDAEVEGFCIFHKEGYWKKSKEHEERVRNAFMEEIERAKKGEKLVCIGYYLPDIKLKGEIKGEIYFNRAVVQAADFKEVKFHQYIDFSYVEFQKDADFSHTEISKEAYFNSVKFLRKAEFGNASFLDLTYFNNVNFSQEANFQATTFLKYAGFINTKFQQDANFRFSKFKQRADYSKAIFSQKADFGGVTFHHRTYFIDATFKQQAYFNDSVFQQWVSFNSVSFQNLVDFSGTRFSRETNFYNVTFQQQVDFSQVLFEKKVNFDTSIFHKNTDFVDTIFQDLARFFKVIFKQQAVFDAAIFQSSAYFNGVKFLKETSFNNTKFQQWAVFNKVTFHLWVTFSHTLFKNANFISVKFEQSAGFDNAEFRKAVLFKDTVFIIDKDFIHDKKTFFIDFRRVKFDSPEKIIFDHCNLSLVSFIHTDITRIKFRNITWPRPTDWKTDSILNKLSSRFGKREAYRLLDEELLVRKKEGIEPHKNDPDLTIENILTVYRMLRENYEYNVDYETAGRFFVGEMETKRINSESSADKFVLWLYKTLALYGQSYNRPLYFLFGLIAWFAFLRGLILFFQGITSIDIALEIILESFAVSLQIKGTEGIDIIQRILSIPLLVLFGLALRRRFERRFRH